MKAVFFDLDGTLTDPREGIVGSLRYALDGLDLPAPDDDVLSNCIGPPLLQSLQGIVGVELAPRALELYRERFDDRGWRENAVYPDVTAVLSRLRTERRSLFVATSKPLVFAKRILNYFNLDSYFDRVFGSELDGTRADKRELLRYALEEVNPHEGALMVGDRKHDVLGAHANAIEAVGVTYGYGSRRELTDAGADLIVDTPEAIPAALDQLA